MSGLIYFLILFTLLLILAFQSFSYPPMSDDWHLFHYFHHLDELPGKVKWLHVLNYDPYEKMRYQPMSRVFYYILHKTFGSDFIFFRIFNFLSYFLSIIFLYKFSLYFVKNKRLAMTFAAIFTFLFINFNFVLWPHHVFIVIGLSLMLAGFISYIKYLNAPRPHLFLFTGSLFLLGLWCYEAFFLWPFGIIILSSIKGIGKKARGGPKGNIFKINSSLLSAVYVLYVIFYFFTRTLGTHAEPLHDFPVLLNVGNFFLSGFLAFFSALYYGLAVNIFPMLAFPLKIAQNAYLGGPIIDYINRGHEATGYAIGGMALILSLYLLIRLYAKKYIEEAKIVFLFLFLMISELWIIFLARIATKNFVYTLIEFRYQYVCSVFIILIALFMADRFVMISKKRGKILRAALALVLILNIYCNQKLMTAYDSRFVDLKKMMSNIKAGLKSKSINASDKIYVYEDMPDYFPSLCWNIDLSERFIEKGNYKWMFSAEELNSFSDDTDDAYWIIDRGDFGIAKKSKRSLSKKGEKTGEGKYDQYMHLAYVYKTQGNHRKEKEMLFKIKELNAQKQSLYEIDPR